MANWCNLHLTATGSPEHVAPFRKAAGALKGKIRAEKSTIFTEEMVQGEASDLTADGVSVFGRRFQQADYRFQGRNTDYADHFLEVSARYPSLAFVLTFNDPNDDSNGSYLFLKGRQWIWNVGRRLHRQLMMKHYRKWKLLDSRGHVDYDASEADWAEWDAYFEMMDIAGAHWDTKILEWLRAQRTATRLKNWTPK